MQKQAMTDSELWIDPSFNCETLLRSLLGSFPIAFALLNRDLCYVAASDRWLSEHRLTKDILGRSHLELFPHLPPSWNNLYQNCLTENRDYTEEHWDTEKCWRWEILPWNDPTEENLGVILIATDITESKQAKFIEERWQLAVSGSNDGIWDWNIATSEEYFSPRWKETLGYTDGEIAHKEIEWEKRVHPDDLKRVRQEGKDHLNRKTSFFRSEYRLLCKDGSYKWILDRGQAQWDENGIPIRMVGTQQDIHQRKLTEEALAKSEARFQRLVANIPGTIYQFCLSADGSLSFPYMSSYCETLYELDSTQIQQDAEAVLSLTHPEDRQLLADSIALSAQTLQPWNSEHRVITPSGKLKWIQAASRPERQENGDTLWDGVSIDISEQQAALHERKLAETALKESKRKLEEAQRLAHIGNWEYDPATGQISWTDEVFRIHGLSIEQGVPSFEDLLTRYHPSDRQVFLTAVDRALRYGESYNIEHSLIRPDGETRYINGIGGAVVNDQGQTVRLYGTVMDISDRKMAELALQEQEQFLRTIYDSVNQEIFVIDVQDDDLRYSGWNAVSARTTGLSSDTGKGKTPEAVFGQELGTQLRQKYQSCLDAKASISYEAPFSLNGQTIWGLTTLTPLWDETERIYRIVGTAIDITERKQAEQALQEQEQFLRTIYDSVDQAIFVIQASKGDLHYSGWNAIAEQIAGVSSSLAKGKTPEAIFGTEVGSLIRQRYETCLISKAPTRYEESFINDGQTTWTLTTLTPLWDETEKVYRIVGTAIDITERKQAEQALQESEAMYRQILDAIPDMVLCKGSESRILYGNKAFREFYNMTNEELRDIIDSPINHPDYTQQYIRDDAYVFNTGQTLNISEEPVVRHDGEVRLFHTIKTPIFNSDGQVVQTVGVSRDATERKQAEKILRQSEAQLREKAEHLQQALLKLQHTQAQLVQTEKMSSLGQLVAGVAHEINNPVSFIYGNLTHVDEYIQDLLHLIGLYQRYYPHPHPDFQAEAEAIELDFLTEDLPKLIASMRVGADRIRTIVLALRNFSRMDEVGLKRVDLHEGIDSTLMILENRLKQVKNDIPITVTKEYGNLPLVECYAGQLNQVFMNIISNAIDALVGDRQPNELQAMGKPALKAIAIQTSLVNQQIEIRIKDNGLGMTEDVRQRIFEPFFTTKAIGKGTGLSLSISYQVIVERHGGNLSCISSPGKGTEFIIELPLSKS